MRDMNPFLRLNAPGLSPWKGVPFALCLMVLPALPLAGQAPVSLPLPGATLYPESIAYQAATGDYYVGSLTDGSVVRGNIHQQQTQVILPAGSDGRQAAAGIKIDASGRLFIAGGQTGKLFVYQAATGTLLGAFKTEAAASVVNDIALMPNGDAYVTDTSDPVLYRVREQGGKLVFEPWLNFTGTAVRYQEGYNINGIVGTADGKYLIAVQTNTGKLFRINAQTREVSEIAFAAPPLVHGDGMALDGHSLYVARNVENQVVALRLTEDFSRATVAKTYTNPSFRFPTALAKEGRQLLVVNAQLDRLSPGRQPELPFSLTRLPLD